MTALRHLPIVVVVLAVSGCRLEAARALHEPVEMGPFTFTVDGASKESRSPCDMVIVELTLKESRGAKVHFDDFLNDMTTPKLIIYPALAIVDPEGHRTSGLVSRVSGRERWQAKFQLDEQRGNQTDTRRATKACGDWRLSDLRLTITNPDRRAGQWRRVSVALQ